MKITYIIMSAVQQIFFLSAMLLAPIYITPGYYFWSVLFFILTIFSGMAMSDRIVQTKLIINFGEFNV